MKKFILLGFMLCGALAHAQESRPPPVPPSPPAAPKAFVSQGERVEIKDAGFSMTAPVGWQVEPPVEGQALLFQAPKPPSSTKEFTYQANIRVMAFYDKPTAIDDIAKEEWSKVITEKMGSLSNRTDEFSLLSAEKVKLQSGADAILFYSSFKYDSVQMMQMHILVSNAKNTFLMTYTDLGKVFEAQDQALTTAYTSMHSAQLDSEPAPRFQNFIYAGAGVAALIVFLLMIRLIRGWKVKRLGDSIDDDGSDTTTNYGTSVSTVTEIDRGSSRKSRRDDSDFDDRPKKKSRRDEDDDDGYSAKAKKKSRRDDDDEDDDRPSKKSRRDIEEDPVSAVSEMYEQTKKKSRRDIEEEAPVSAVSEVYEQPRSEVYSQHSEMPTSEVYSNRSSRDQQPQSEVYSQHSEMPTSEVYSSRSNRDEQPRSEVYSTHADDDDEESVTSMESQRYSEPPRRVEAPAPVPKMVEAPAPVAKKMEAPAPVAKAKPAPAPAQKFSSPKPSSLTAAPSSRGFENRKRKDGAPAVQTQTAQSHASSQMPVSEMAQWNLPDNGQDDDVPLSEVARSSSAPLSEVQEFAKKERTKSSTRSKRDDDEDLQVEESEVARLSEILPRDEPDDMPKKKKGGFFGLFGGKDKGTDAGKGTAKKASKKPSKRDEAPVSEVSEAWPVESKKAVGKSKRNEQPVSEVVGGDGWALNDNGSGNFDHDDDDDN